MNNRDNEEQVTVPTPEKGTWLVRVIGTTVPQGPQDYSLACEGCRAVNAGVCQAIVDNTPLLAAAPLIPNSEGDEFVPQAPPAAAAISAGEQWQRDLEQGRSDAAQLTANFTSQEDLPYNPIDLSRPTDPDRAKADRLNAALREFDAARNAGPEAVIAFADRSDGEVRASDRIRSESKRKHDIAARANPIASFHARQRPTPSAWASTARARTTPCKKASTPRRTARPCAWWATSSLRTSTSRGKNITIEGGYNATCTAIVTGTVSRIDGVASRQRGRCDAAAAS